jgi:hypoxanthine phosphoribosyltransferase
MMDSRIPPTVTCHGEPFRLYIPPETIAARVAELGREISAAYAGREPVLLGVLTGACVFLADLVRQLDMTCAIEFVKLASYGAARQSSGTVREVLGLESDVRGRDLLVVEDIVDTGLSIRHLLDRLERRAPASLRVATFLHKAEATTVDVPLHHVGFRIPNLFVIGYGLDYNQAGRSLPGVYIQDQGGPPPPPPVPGRAASR